MTEHTQNGRKFYLLSHSIKAKQSILAKMQIRTWMNNHSDPFSQKPQSRIMNRSDVVFGAKIINRNRVPP
jgi:hypothetical protein